MDVTLLIAAFGGGLLATSIGGVSSFVFTGLTVLAAVMGGDFGAPAITIIGFGSWFGPMVAFGGAVAGAAFAMNRNHIENGQDIVTPLCKFGDPMVLIVGGLFGMVGFLLNFAISGIVGPALFTGLLGKGAAAWTDTVAFSVVLSGMLARLVFGKTGLTGKAPAGEARKWFPSGQRLAFLVVLGLGIGLLIGGVAAALGTLGFAGSKEAMMLFTNVPVIGFAVAAISLMFISMGYAFEGWHHIVLPAGSTAVFLFTATGSPIAALVGGAVTGILGAVIGEWAGMTFNSYADTHIDPPAVTIFILQTINTCILSGLILA